MSDDLASRGCVEAGVATGDGPSGSDALGPVNSDPFSSDASGAGYPGRSAEASPPPGHHVLVGFRPEHLDDPGAAEHLEGTPPEMDAPAGEERLLASDPAVDIHPSHGSSMPVAGNAHIDGTIPTNPEATGSKLVGGPEHAGGDSP